jgi:hypothetical protein
LQFISRANYGRLLVLSLEDNIASHNQVDQLARCANFGVIDTTCMSIAMRELRQNPTLRYYFAGVDQTLPLEEN